MGVGATLRACPVQVRASGAIDPPQRRGLDAPSASQRGKKSLQRVLAVLPRPNAYRLGDVHHEDLSVANLACLCCAHDRFEDVFRLAIGHDDLELH